MLRGEKRNKTCWVHRKGKRLIGGSGVVDGDGDVDVVDGDVVDGKLRGG